MESRLYPKGTVSILLCYYNKSMIKTVKRIFSILPVVIALGFFIPVKSQNFFVKGDLVSSYIWRGMKNGGISLQPSFGFNYKGLSIYAWASTSFQKEKNEIDLYIDYSYRNLKLSFGDFFTQGADNQFKYFDYRSGHTRHVYDLGAEYTICDRFPLKVSWYTMVAGDDFIVNGRDDDYTVEKRCFSTYIELQYPFSVKDVDCSVALGLTPWKGFYAENAAVNNVALSISREFRINENLSLPLTGKLIGNPYENKIYVMLGLGFCY